MEKLEKWTGVCPNCGYDMKPIKELTLVDSNRKAFVVTGVNAVRCGCGVWIGDYYIPMMGYEMA